MGKTSPKTIESLEQQIAAGKKSFRKLTTPVAAPTPSFWPTVSSWI